MADDRRSRRIQDKSTSSTPDLTNCDGLRSWFRSLQMTPIQLAASFAARPTDGSRGAFGTARIAGKLIKRCQILRAGKLNERRDLTSAENPLRYSLTN
jgi:hypothetical protein